MFYIVACSLTEMFTDDEDTKNLLDREFFASPFALSCEVLDFADSSE